MPRSDFLRVGMEGLAVKRGQDDREFGIRCAQAGIRPGFDPALVAEHLYDRALGPWRGACLVPGHPRVMLHEAHADVVGEGLVENPRRAHVADAVGMGLPKPLRRVWPMLARDPLFEPVTKALTGLFALGVRSEHLGLEVQAARAIGSLETMRGVLERS